MGRSTVPCAVPPRCVGPAEWTPPSHGEDAGSIPARTAPGTDRRRQGHAWRLSRRPCSPDLRPESRRVGVAGGRAFGPEATCVRPRGDALGRRGRRAPGCAWNRPAPRQSSPALPVGAWVIDNGRGRPRDLDRRRYGSVGYVLRAGRYVVHAVAEWLSGAGRFVPRQAPAVANPWGRLTPMMRGSSPRPRAVLLRWSGLAVAYRSSSTRVDRRWSRRTDSGRHEAGRALAPRPKGGETPVRLRACHEGSGPGSNPGRRPRSSDACRGSTAPAYFPGIGPTRRDGSLHVAPGCLAVPGATPSLPPRPRDAERGEVGCRGQAVRRRRGLITSSTSVSAEPLRDPAETTRVGSHPGHAETARPIAG